MPLTPKVKLNITSGQLAEILNLPTNEVEILYGWVLPDPFSITLVLASDTAFNDIYAPYGGFNPTISHETIYLDFFDEPEPQP